MTGNIEQTITSANGDNVDYIISYRQSSVDRKNALMYVTAWLHRCFPLLNIIVVEQDSSQKLVAAELPFCQLLFVYNEGLFNRGWANNVAIAHSSRPFLVFADCDIFLAKSDYQVCFNALQSFEAVDPKKPYMNNVKLNDVTMESEHSAQFQIKNQRYGNTFAGAIFFIRRASIVSLGLWDEAFEGWGGEDNAMEHVIRIFLRQCRLQLEVFHIDHSRTILDTKSQPNYHQNSARSRAICAEHGQALLEYVEQQKYSRLGCKDKYRQVIMS